MVPLTLTKRGVYGAIAVLLLALLEVSQAQSAERYSLNGQWQFARGVLQPSDGYRLDTSIANWRKLSVPANWQNEGIDHSGSAWYRRDLPRNFIRGYQRLDANDQAIAFARFSGVDYAADVWVNAQHVGFHEGYFAPFEVNITDALSVDKSQQLVVRVDSPEERAGPSWGLHKRLLKGVLSHHDTRPGGAWSHRGQEKNTGGIWGDVAVDVAQGVYLAEPVVTPLLKYSENGELAKVAVEVRAGAKQFRGLERAELHVRFYEPGTKQLLFEAPLGTVSPKRPSLHREFEIADPKLWWPAGRGRQPLYEAEVIAVNESNQELHSKKTKFGLRTVRRDKTTGEWFVNNTRFFLKGTNYIATQWKSNFSKQDYIRDLKLMLAANVNSVRVHAQVEAERFYEAADELGMLVWQDFPLQWGYRDSPELYSAAEAQLDELIEFLHNHPSIIAWSIHNEPPWDADWMKWKYDDYDPSQNRTLDERLYKLARKQDKSRYVHKVSRTQEHQWFGWYSGTIDTFAKPLGESLVSEFGAQALPVLSSLKKIISKAHLWPTDRLGWAEWDYKNFQHKETFELAKVAMPTDTQSFIDNTQKYQSELITFAGAAYRSRQYEPLGAMFQFMFVEDWPSINWGVVDWYRQPKPGYYALKTIFAPVLAVPVLPGRTLVAGEHEIPIKISSDLWSSTSSVQILVGLTDSAGQVVEGSQRQYVATANADAVEQVAMWRFAVTAGEYRMRVTTKAPNQELVDLEIELTVATEGADE